MNERMDSIVMWILVAIVILVAVIAVGILVARNERKERQGRRSPRGSARKKVAPQTTQTNSVDPRVSFERMLSRRQESNDQYRGVILQIKVPDLIEIGRRDGFLATGRSFDVSGKEIGNPSPPPGFNEKWRNIRAIAIGHELNNTGGFELMREAHDQVKAQLGASLARHLEACWGGVGDWRA